MKHNKKTLLAIKPLTRLQKRGLQMIISFICLLLQTEYSNEELQQIDGRIFYTESNGFDDLDDESGSFLVKFKNGDLAINAALTVYGLVSFISIVNKGVSHCRVTDYYVHEKKVQSVSPFHSTKDFYSFRKQLKSLDPDKPIAIIDDLICEGKAPMTSK